VKKVSKIIIKKQKYHEPKIKVEKIDLMSFQEGYG
jgi:hypothetical protein